ncbi:MAG: hypothetical protein DRO67_00920 [Candidatus Asgardarchaeum californiense]|nr:MAG: hypothetical protein DRO67_00920 [Candidatus Asgardarchaeum californiense]
MKRCSKCGLTLPLSSFYFISKTGKNCNRCKDCERERVKLAMRKWHATPTGKSESRRRALIQHNELQQKLNNLKAGLCCTFCGYSDFRALEFHHLDPSKKKYNISAARTTRKDFGDEVAKCICLCANCHRILHTTFRNTKICKAVK